jgi:hypothetical protein
MIDTIPVNPDDPSTWGNFTPSTKRLNEIVGVITQSRRLTPEECELLFKSKREMARHFEYLMQIREKGNTSKP